MTVEERRNPDLLASSPGRRRRIASGAGYEADVGKLVSDFQKMRSLMQQMGQGGFPGMNVCGMVIPYAADGIVPATGWRGSNKKKEEGKKKTLGRFKGVRDKPGLDQDVLVRSQDSGKSISSSPDP